MSVFPAVFHPYNTWLIKRHFSRVHLHRNSHAPASGRTIVVMNHSTWWDPLLLLYLNQRLWNLDGRALMDREGLDRFPFFEKVGALPVDTSTLQKTKESLAEASAVLDDEKPLFLFPQGREVPLGAPIRISSGAAWLKTEVPDTRIYNMTFYHGLFHQQQPEWFVYVSEITGAPSWSRKQWTSHIQTCMQEQFHFVQDQIFSRDQADWQTVLRGAEGIGAAWENVKGLWKGAGR
ncbi:lysophospholipid acyltransferase family protein [Alkalicoccus urumqiensis]|uniref:Phospholipid/glycerol acyltransferase domain-containing protein n=1 Tax=Alkalicoccus urumqiensis TaxID=1548213 RepID=A0A2P6MKI0_ALKUR|nr:lysophospholipid acyltransferase family protein [Alkalicoccus urumqiensis]PRO66755.1 hypothetical protein C6I21_02170 [Alkalicoccus urumqiensis]